MVAGALDAVAEQFSACEALAFADLGTSMVLITNTANQSSREVLDALCAEAVATLGALDAAPLGSGTANLAVTATATETKIFLRGGPEGTDALCCLCAPNVNLGLFLPEVQSCFDSILAG